MKKQINNSAPVDHVERWPITKLVPYARNPRLHSPAQIDQIAGSMKEFGQAQIIVVDEQGEIVAGHGRVLAAEQLGWKEMSVGIAIGWSKAQRRKYRIVDNQLALSSSWDSVLLQTEFADLGLSLDQLAGYGFGIKELEDLSIVLPGMETEKIEGGDKLIDLIDVTIGDPKHVVEKGDHYKLAERHDLFCVSVIEGWQAWVPLLTEGSLFCPYPGVFVPFSQKAKASHLVMVQPDIYIAGHILDRFAEVNNESAIRKVIK